MTHWTIAALVAGLQLVPPPIYRDGLAPPGAYDRTHSTRLFENERVRVWDVAWLKRRYPDHLHGGPSAGVYYTSGNRIILSPTGERRTVSAQAWSVVYEGAGAFHIEEGASDPPLKAVFFEFKGIPRGQDDQRPDLPPFPAGQGNKVLDNELTTAWEFVPLPATTTRTHRHVRDALVISFTGRTPRVRFVDAGTEHRGEGERADRGYVFELK